MKNFVDYDIWVPQNVEKPGCMMILDAGHGGIHNKQYTTAPYKMCDFGDFVFYEGEVNRILVSKLAAKFKENSIAHAFTTTSNLDESLDARGVKIGNVVNSYPKYHHTLLSVHHNAAGESAHGTEFWTTHGINESDYAANIYFPRIYEFGLKFRINRAKENEYDKEENWKILRLAEKHGCSSILFEIGFFSNREEALKMLEDEFQNNVVNALYKGTVDLITKIKRDGTVKPA